MTLRERMEEHIKLLCLLYEIEWWQGVPLSIANHPYKGTIQTPPIHGQLQYFTALHEIAHEIHGHTVSPMLKVEKEAEAWHWALDQAIVEPNEGVLQDIFKSIVSYLTEHEDDPRVSPAPVGGLAEKLVYRLGGTPLYMM